MYTHCIDVIIVHTRPVLYYCILVIMLNHLASYIDAMHTKFMSIIIMIIVHTCILCTSTIRYKHWYMDRFR